MLSLWKRKPEPQTALPRPTADAVKRDRQQNIKVSEDCSALFAALAEAQGISKARRSARHQQGRLVRRYGGGAARDAAAARRKDRGFGWLA
jgi:hypothetical protein